MEKSDFSKLNMAAQELFGQPDNPDDSKADDSYIDELAQLNNWRKNILEFTNNLAATLDGFNSSAPAVNSEERIRPLIENIDALTSIPTKGSDKKIIIRHRGLGRSAENAERDVFFDTDYVISVGDCVIDTQQLQYLVKFGIMDGRELGRKLQKTFQFFHLAGIYILEIYYHDWDAKDKQNFRDALVCWGRYLGGRQKGLGVILDDTGQPDPNLSILAGLNKIPAEKFQAVADKVRRVMIQDSSGEKFKDAESIYDAVFLIDDLKSKLLRSPIEVNNNKYIQVWRQCFDETGRFGRTRFNQYRSMFLKWEDAFYIFWVDLKSVTIADDRDAILNCIVRFIADSRSLDEYVDYILKDFYYYPLHILFSDRDSLFIANLLLLKNYVNITYDFGHTPGEVLLSGDLLNKEFVGRLRAKLTDRVVEKFVQKIMTMKKLFKLSLAASEGKDNLMPVTFLINVMREVYIFLTLVWDKEFKLIVRDAVKEFTNTKSVYYRSKNSPAVIFPLLQFFQIIILCLVKLGDEKDIDLLNAIRSREEDFLSMKGFLTADSSSHKQLVSKIMSVVDEGIISLGTGGGNGLDDNKKPDRPDFQSPP
jgi:hypothetical protein